MTSEQTNNPEPRFEKQNDDLIPDRDDSVRLHGSYAAGEDDFDWAGLVRNIALVLVLLLMLWLAFNVRLPSLDELHAAIASWGWAAWLVFIGVYAVVALTPIPVTIMAVTGGLLFGFFEGTLLSVIGVLIGCWGAYWIARGLGHESIAKLLGSRYRTVERHLDQAGFQAVAGLRLLPGFPYWPVNYGSGAFGVSQRDYMAASTLSVIPGQISLVAIGNFISFPNLLNGIIVAVAWIVVFGLTIWAYRRWKAAKEDEEASRDDGADR